MKNIQYIWGVKVETRKLIKFGTSSHIVSLPSTWTKKNNLNKGDLIYIHENENSELLISAEKKEPKKEITETTIDIDKKTRLEIKRELVAAYIQDYSLIRIIGKELQTQLKDVRTLLNQFIALEIIEQTSTKIVAQDFLNIKDASFDKIIRRIDTIIKSILEDIGFKDKKDCYESIIIRDSDLNRLAYLGFKMIKRALKNQQVAHELSTTPPELLNNWLMILKLEKIGDSLKRIERNRKSLTITQKEKEHMIALYTKLKSTYYEIMKAYYENDQDAARRIADERRKNLFDCVKFGEKYLKFRSNQVVEHFKDIHTYIGDISRMVYLREPN